jgi:hypothetical protein
MAEIKSKSPKCQTVGSRTFNPDEFFNAWPKTVVGIKDASFEDFILDAFGINIPDDYVYYASASVSLQQVQKAIDAGDARGLHAWYQDENGIKVSVLLYMASEGEQDQHMTYARF